MGRKNLFDSVSAAMIGNLNIAESMKLYGELRAYLQNPSVEKSPADDSMVKNRMLEILKEELNNG